jgi:hypothetical protein
LKSLAYGDEFLDEPVHAPDHARAVVGRLTTAKLVVENYGAFIAEVLQRLQVVVGKPRSTMKAKEGNRALTGAYRPKPDLAVGYGQETLARVAQASPPRVPDRRWPSPMSRLACFKTELRAV